MTTPASQDSDVALTDVMLAMDVVDTLRHEDRMVAQALNAEAREQQLIDRVRRAYASQGIEVSDTMIEQGVASLKAQEFHYEAPAPGVRARIATAWVNRARIGTGVGFFAGLAAIIGLAWYGLVAWPEATERREQADTLNQAVVIARTDVDLARQRAASITRAFNAVDDGTIDARTRRAYDTTAANVSRALTNAEQALTTAVATTLPASLDADNVAERAASTQQTLARQRDSIVAANTALDTAEQGVTTLQSLGSLQAELLLLRDEALALATQSNVRANIQTEFNSATAALAAGDSVTAAQGAQSLRDDIAALRLAYTVRIVSRPGVSSGIIREPPNNRRASNYYLIVEATDSNGQLVTVDITSEEDGTRRSVSRWGIRVNESVFNSIRRDKSDDGIIQSALAGRKARGKIDIDYTLTTSGGAIHSWQEPR